MDKASAWGARASHVVGAMCRRSPALFATAVVSIFCLLVITIAASMESAGLTQGTLDESAAGDEDSRRARVEQVVSSDESVSGVRYFSAGDGDVACEVTEEVTRCAAATWRRTGLGMPQSCPPGEVAVAELATSASISCGAPVPFSGDPLAADVTVRGDAHECKLEGNSVACNVLDGSGGFVFAATSASMT